MDEDSSMEQRTWQVYSFGKNTVIQVYIWIYTKDLLTFNNNRDPIIQPTYFFFQQITIAALEIFQDGPAWKTNIQCTDSGDADQVK